MNVCLLQVAKEAVIGLSNKLSIDLILVIVLYCIEMQPIEFRRQLECRLFRYFLYYSTATVTQSIFTSSMHSTQITICVACSSNICGQMHTKNNERLQSKWFKIKSRLKCFEIWIWFQLFFFLCSDCIRQFIFIICCFSMICHCLRYFDRYDILWNKFWMRNAMFADHCVIKTRSKT